MNCCHYLLLMKMNIKEYMKFRVNDKLYGMNWKNKSWANNYIKSFQQYSITGNKFETETRKDSSQRQELPINISLPLTGGMIVNNESNMTGGFSTYGQENETTNIEQPIAGSATPQVDLKNEIGFTIKDTFIGYPLRFPPRPCRIGK